MSIEKSFSGAKNVMVWIAVGSKGQDLALNYARVCLYFWLNGFHLSMPGNNSCATQIVRQCHLLVLKLMTSKVVQGKWPFHGFQYLASFRWFRRECDVTLGIKESVICVCGWNRVVLTYSNEFSSYSSTFTWSYM